jgi:hypothetical protein
MIEKHLTPQLHTLLAYPPTALNTTNNPPKVIRPHKNEENDDTNKTPQDPTLA